MRINSHIQIQMRTKELQPEKWKQRIAFDYLLLFYSIPFHFIFTGIQMDTHTYSRVHKKRS